MTATRWPAFVQTCVCAHRGKGAVGDKGHFYKWKSCSLLTASPQRKESQTKPERLDHSKPCPSSEPVRHSL